MPFKEARGSGAVHHVALQRTDYDATLARIKALGYDYSESHIEQIRLRQIFVTEANGVLLELNFHGDSA